MPTRAWVLCPGANQVLGRALYHTLQAQESAPSVSRGTERSRLFLETPLNGNEFPESLRKHCLFEGVVCCEMHLTFTGVPTVSCGFGWHVLEPQAKMSLTSTEGCGLVCGPCRGPSPQRNLCSLHTVVFSNDRLKKNLSGALMLPGPSLRWGICAMISCTPFQASFLWCYYPMGIWHWKSLVSTRERQHYSTGMLCGAAPHDPKEQQMGKNFV